MSQIGPELAVGFRAIDRVTVDARGGEEEVTPDLHLDVVGRLAFLRGHPLFELARWMHDDPDQHPGMLCSAILGAIAQVSSRCHRLYPHEIVTVWNDVGFAG